MFDFDFFKIRMDDNGLYHGNSEEITKHALSDGSHIWNKAIKSKDNFIYFGVQVQKPL